MADDTPLNNAVPAENISSVVIPTHNNATPADDTKKYVIMAVIAIVASVVCICISNTFYTPPITATTPPITATTPYSTLTTLLRVNAHGERFSMSISTTVPPMITFVCNGASVTCSIMAFAVNLTGTVTHLSIPVPETYRPQKTMQFLYRMVAWSPVPAYGEFITTTLKNDTIALYFNIPNNSFLGGSGTQFQVGTISFAYVLI